MLRPVPLRTICRSCRRRNARLGMVRHLRRTLDRWSCLMRLWRSEPPFPWAHPAWIYRLGRTDIRSEGRQSLVTSFVLGLPYLKSPWFEISWIWNCPSFAHASHAHAYYPYARQYIAIWYKLCTIAIHHKLNANTMLLSLAFSL